MPSGHKIHQHFSFQDLSNYTQNGIFWIKIYHLATLDKTKTEFEAERMKVISRAKGFSHNSFCIKDGTYIFFAA
jgi:hypothetical protein